MIELTLYREGVADLDTNVNAPRPAYGDTLCSIDVGNVTYKCSELY